MREMSKLHLWKDELIESDGYLTIGSVIESGTGDRRHLWYRCPDRYRGVLTDSCDPFLIGVLFTAMSESRDVIVHGEVSRRLLRNLEEFQSAWAHWLPDRYTKIEITADRETDGRDGHRTSSAIAAFSGGVDGCFTVYRHSRGLCGRLKRDIKSGLLIHGLDIPLERTDIFSSAVEKSRIMLESLNMDLVPLVTNIRELGGYYSDTHGAAVASCLMLFQEGYSSGLIGSTEPYSRLILPWGSNPLTDPLFSSDGMEIVHDGASFTRSDKVEVISDWPEALKHLRVCWQQENMDRNCCSCEKCIRTILNFRILGKDLPECFENDVTDKQISSLKGLNQVPIAYMEEILVRARTDSISDPWVFALDRCIKRNKRASKGWRKSLRELRNRLSLRKRIGGKVADKGSS